MKREPFKDDESWNEDHDEDRYDPDERVCQECSEPLVKTSTILYCENCNRIVATSM